MPYIKSEPVEYQVFRQIELTDRCIEKLAEALNKQKTGHWIDKSRGDQKNSECSECHTLFRVLIKDYPYCPVCGSRNRGEEDV